MFVGFCDCNGVEKRGEGALRVAGGCCRFPSKQNQTFSSLSNVMAQAPIDFEHAGCGGKRGIGERVTGAVDENTQPILEWIAGKQASRYLDSRQQCYEKSRQQSRLVAF